MQAQNRARDRRPVGTTSAGWRCNHSTKLSSMTQAGVNPVADLRTMCVPQAYGAPADGLTDVILPTQSGRGNRGDSDVMQSPPAPDCESPRHLRRRLSLRSTTTGLHLIADPTLATIATVPSRPRTSFRLLNYEIVPCDLSDRGYLLALPASRKLSAKRSTPVALTSTPSQVAVVRGQLGDASRSDCYWRRTHQRSSGWTRTVSGSAGN